MRLLMTVSTALFVPGLFPKKSGAYAMSSSNPKRPRVVPIDAPQSRRFSLQLVRLAQLAESPPKLNPTNGLMKPPARAGVTAQAMSAAARMSIRRGCTASLSVLSGAAAIQTIDDFRLPTAMALQFFARCIHVEYSFL